MESKLLALLCRDYADNKKAENLLVLDVKELSSITDYFVIVTGSSEPHIRAIVDEIIDELRENHQISPLSIDGSLNAPWIVIDYFDVIVHVMRPEIRSHYDLEGLWGDAPRILSLDSNENLATA